MERINETLDQLGRDRVCCIEYMFVCDELVFEMGPEPNYGWGIQ
jgi:hypothetical protein